MDNKYVTEDQVKYLPTKCPCCGSELSWKGVHLICDNPDCADMKTQDLLIWCNNIAPVDGLGDILKLKFFEELCSALSRSLPTGSEVSIEGAYNLAKVYDGIQINPSAGSQYKLFYTMLDGLIHNKVPMYKALLALNIPRLGEVTAKKLAQHIDVIESLVDGCYPAEDLLNIVGEATTGTILENITKFQRLSLIWGNIDKSVSTTDSTKVAITGSLSSMSRKQFEALLNTHGFILGDITKDTKYLITNEANPTSSKAVKASKLGIEIISEADFRNKFGF